MFNPFQILVVDHFESICPHIKQRVIDCWDKKYHSLDELRNRMLVQEYDENKWQLFKQ